jgi:subtilisin family serine protease
MYFSRAFPSIPDAGECGASLGRGFRSTVSRSVLRDGAADTEERLQKTLPASLLRHYRYPVLETGTLMTALELVKLLPLMEQTTGRREIAIGLIDGPVAKDHPDFERQNIRELPGRERGACAQLGSAACRHGTFVAGMLVAKRGSAAPAICPGCSLLVRPIFPETVPGNGKIPSATPQELSTAILDAIGASARILNLSAALVQPSSKGERDLRAALDYAAQRGVIIVVAAGNQGVVGSSIVTRHPWAIPVAGCDPQGRPTSQSNLGTSIGRRGLLAPSEEITSLGSEGEPVTLGGTSAAAPFVTGTIALLWSMFPRASAAELLLAVRSARPPNRAAIVPPMLDASAAYQFMLAKGYAVEKGTKPIKP